MDLFSINIPRIYYLFIYSVFVQENSEKLPLPSSENQLIWVFVYFCYKIIILYSCEDSSMLVSSIIEVEMVFSFNLMQWFIRTYSMFLFYYKILYIWKMIIAKTKTSDSGWSINGIHKWSEILNLNAFFGWTTKINLLLVWKFHF